MGAEFFTGNRRSFVRRTVKLRKLRDIVYCHQMNLRGREKCLNGEKMKWNGTKYGKNYCLMDVMVKWKKCVAGGIVTQKNGDSGIVTQKNGDSGIVTQKNGDSGHMRSPLDARPKTWVCGCSLTGIGGLNPSGGMELLCGWCALTGPGLCFGLIIRPGSPTDCGVPEFSREVWIMRRPWPTRGCYAVLNKVIFNKDADYLYRCTVHFVV